MSRRRRRTAWIGLAAIAAGAALSAIATLPLEDWARHAATGLQAYGLGGTVLFFVAFGLLAMVVVPTSPLSFVAGLVFGWTGAACAWMTMMAVASVSFALARNLAAARIRSAVLDSRRLRLLVGFVDEQGWRIVLLVRVSGIVPFGVQNYVFGAMGMPFGQFIAATAIGVMPSILLAASAGIAGHAALTGAADPLRLAIIGTSVLVSLVLIALTARELRARLAAAEDPLRPAAPPSRA